MPRRTLVERLLGGWPGQALVGVLGVVVTAVVAGGVYAEARADTAAAFQADAEAAVGRIVDQIALGVGAAEATAGLAAASQEVTAAEFAAFTDRLRVGSRYPELSALALTRVVAGQGGATDRWEVVHVAPQEANAGVIGLDLRRYPGTRAIGLSAVDAAEPRMTGPLELGEVVAGDVGLSVLVPLYDGDVAFTPADAAPAERRRRHVGFASTFFRTDELLTVVLGADRRLAVDIVDVDPGGGLLGRHIPDGIDRLPEGRRTATIRRDVFGRQWVVTVSAARGHGVPIALPVALAVTGLVVTAMLLLVIHGVDRSGQRARRMAATATADLRRSQAALAAANDELSRQNRALQRANVELSRFAHLASHDLKQPVQLVIAFADLLRDLLTTRLGEEGLEEMEVVALDKIRQGGLRMRRLIDDLLDLAVADRGGQRLARLDVTAAVDQAVEVLADRVQATGARVEIGRLDPVVMDERQLEPLLQNLIDNAIKYHRPGVAPVVQVQAVAEEGSWRLTVTDNGIGIAPADRESVFEAFMRLDRGADVEGSGVGLAICAAIVEGHGGDIAVEDGIDGGTRVVVTLPQPPRPPGGVIDGRATGQADPGQVTGIGSGRA